MKVAVFSAFAVLLSLPAFAQEAQDDLDLQVEKAFQKFLQGRRSSDLLAAPPRTTQDEERVKRIVERIEKEIRESHERTREEIRAIIRAEMQKASGKQPSEARPDKPAPAAPPRKVYLGITAGDLTDAERKALGVGGGIKVADVRGPAKEAQIKAGDILVELDGEPVSEERIGGILGRHKPGDTIDATVLRSGKRVSLKVVLGERKE
jgi:S1-C subfamily serine protease